MEYYPYLLESIQGKRPISAIYEDWKENIRESGNSSKENSCLSIDFTCETCGMFSTLLHVLGALKKAEEESYACVAIQFGQKGLYYDPKHGDNWWEYYFMPMRKTDGVSLEPMRESEYADLVFETEGKISRKEAYELIQKHIRIRPDILAEVDEFVERNFVNQGQILGLHYRGTDKGGEAELISYEKIFARIDHYLNGPQKIEKYKIFVASDEEAFVEAAKKRYPGKIIVSNAERSKDGKPLHFSDQDKYQMGKSALIDMLLLSRIHILFRTSSNLSFFSTLFSPNLAVFSLTERGSNAILDEKISQLFLMPKAPDFGRCSHGMFAVAQCMLGVFHEYESKNYGGIKLDFGDIGCYYDPDHGSNWWNYYFEPVYEGEETGRQIRTFTELDYANPHWVGKHFLLRSEAHQLIRKYFKIKPEIQDEVDTFVREHFEGRHIIGIHYRGTDKKSEAERTDYDTVFDSIRGYIKEEKLEAFKIFVATDEASFIDAIEKKFPGRILMSQAKRSEDSSPLHLHLNHSNESPYRHGKEALFDAILLSKGNVIIRTASNLSLFSTYLNPDIPVILLSLEE